MMARASQSGALESCDGTPKRPMKARIGAHTLTGSTLASLES